MSAADGETSGSGRPVGRPRAVPHLSEGDPRQEILAASARLFATVGYTATSTRSIAEAVGLRQASLFHYYPRKEAILNELLEGTVRPTLDLVRHLARAGLGPEASLWLLVERDVANLGRGSHNPGALQLLPEAHAPQFDWFWKRRSRLFAFYRRQVREGITLGRFSDAAGEATADLVFGLVESVITARPPVRSDPATPARLADATLRMLEVSPSRVRRARRDAAGFEVPPARRGRKAVKEPEDDNSGTTC